jgi:anti-anti-sigma regulatory factor
MAATLCPSADCMEILVTSNDTGPNARNLRRLVLDTIDRGLQKVVLDCRGWHEFDLALLSALVRSADALRHRGATLELVNVSAQISGTIRELRLASRLGLVS